MGFEVLYTVIHEVIDMILDMLLFIVGNSSFIITYLILLPWTPISFIWLYFIMDFLIDETR